MPFATVGPHFEAGGASSVEAVQNAAPSPRLRLEFLDGMRGLAALYVVLGHTLLLLVSKWSEPLHWQYESRVFPLALQSVLHCFELGHYAVVLFIVLSGYCLMLPVARSKDGTLSGGVIGYVKRRARRILPPYYAALGLSLLLMTGLFSSPALNDFWRYMTFPLYTPGVLVSHLLLFHNLRADWGLKIDNPLWSVATEWQIYFVFALILLPVWRRFGTMAALLMSFVVGLAPHFLLHHRFDAACPWFVGLFALGMAGAVVSFRLRPVETWLRERLSWEWLALGGSVLLCAISGRSGFSGSRQWIADTLMGLVSLCAILGCTRAALRHDRSALALRVFESRPAVALGRFSYSLYLIHMPILVFARCRLMGFLEPSPLLLGLLLLGAVPLSVGAAYLFYLVFERRFMSPPRRAMVVAAAAPR